MTDNCSELHDALRAVWEEAILLLCIFDLMQQVWRWLFDRKNNIQAADRPLIMNLFRKVVYAEDEEDAEEMFEELVDSIQNYMNLVLYIKEVYEIRERWCVAYRKHLILRGNNTNNYVEAQFLVIKDNVLNRTKEVNINGLLDKLTSDFDEHYKAKLISACNSRFDGIYSVRFKGISKSKGSGVGYKLPPFKEHKTFEARITETEGGFYIVPSFTCAETQYLVDMDMGICECAVGSDGSVCKHQYFVWIYRHRKSVNFVPYMDIDMRKEYCYIALGKVLEDSYFEGLHDEVFNQTSSDSNMGGFELGGGSSKNVTEESQNSQDTQTQGANSVMIGRGRVDKWTVSECKDTLQNAVKILEGLVESRSHDQTFLKGIVKFADRVGKYQNQPSKISSSLHSFGTTTYSRKQVTATSLLKKARLGKKIHVQPGAVSRRIEKNGSKNAIVKGMRKRVNPFQIDAVSTKRPHSFSDNVKSNVALPKKAGRTMSSRTKLKNPNKKRPETESNAKENVDKK